MSDKRLHIDKKFTDRAWADMRRLLDEEMPVQEKDRRLPLFWWWLAAALLVGGSATAIWLQQGRNLPPKPATPAPAVAAVEMGNHVSDASKNGASTVPVADEVALVKTIENQSVVTKKTTGSVIEPGVFTQIKPALPFQNFDKKTNLPNIGIPDKTTVRNPGESNSTLVFVAEKEAETQQPLSPEEPGRIEYQVTDVSYLRIQPLTAPEEKQPVFSKLPIDVDKYPGSHAFYASASTSFPNTAEGLSAGWLKNFRPAQSKWSVETGLGYHFVRQPLSITVVETTDNSTTPNPTVTEVTATVDYGYENVIKSSAVNQESSVKTSAYQDLALHYAEIPLLAGWQATPRLRLQTGITASALLISAPDFTRGGLIERNKGGLDEQFNSLADADSTAVKISRFDLATSAGLRYALTRRISADFRYQFGWTDALKSNKVNDFNRLFRLSLVFRL